MAPKLALTTLVQLHDLRARLGCTIWSTIGKCVEKCVEQGIYYSFIYRSSCVCAESLPAHSYRFMYRAFRRASERVLSFRNVWKSLQLGAAQLGAAQCVAQQESDMPLATVSVSC